MFAIDRALRAAGYRTVSLPYETRRWSLDRIVENLRRQVAAKTRDAEKLHFVTHSKGGLIARATLSENLPDNLGSVVMLGPPNQGSEWTSLMRRMGIARLALLHANDLLAIERTARISLQLGEVKYPVGIIAGNRPIDPIFPRLVLPLPNDGKVSVSATHLEGETDHIVLPVPHTAMLWNKQVQRQILAFLQDGTFAR